MTHWLVFMKQISQEKDND